MHGKNLSGKVYSNSEKSVCVCWKFDTCGASIINLAAYCML